MRFSSALKSYDPLLPCPKGQDTVRWHEEVLPLDGDLLIGDFSLMSLLS
jgi:hypothetical protein